MHLLLAIGLLGFVLPPLDSVPMEPRFSVVSGSPAHSGLRVAGICVGSAQECLKEAIADGELSAEEAALPYEVFITFAYNSAELSEDARAELRTLADVLNDPILLPRKFLIEGHTDARGDEAYNQMLSERRAAAVRDFLGAAGIDVSRLSSVGYGESRPRTSDPRAPENRRVELKIAP